ncbi:glycosyl transferase [Methylacidiphilum sp. Yel]|jgi:GT2 family glycosyltransferase|uniref:glycosyltransferase family 2 protein n=1 Tax=Methylacidiphilum sp. Yel TaxID=1847730 RepID=UPI00106C3662|nr:glycosyltransferase family 2 protein [Methylacidiphilum sp. Yel]TFE66066.1 glycosyl transferase [Methylacidiphilum sp. Yel]
MMANRKIEEPIDWSVIIVTFQSQKVIKNCLESLFYQRGVRSEIFVVDNNSTDGTKEILEAFSTKIFFIENPSNEGFAKAANKALSRAKGRFVLFLNPDVVIKNPYFLEKIAALFDEIKTVGAIGPSLYYPDGQIQPTTSLQYPNQKWTLGSIPKYPGNIAALLGACLAIRKEILDQIGGFDEDYFLYGEDQDICLRIRKLGFSLAYSPQIQAYHIGGHSSENLSYKLLWERKLQAEYIFYKKHYPQQAIDLIAFSQLIKSNWQLFLLFFFGSSLLPKSRLHEKICKYKAIRSQAFAHLFHRFNQQRQP